MRYFLWRWWYWHLDGAVRYAPAVRLIRNHGNAESRILEIGSGAAGLSLFLPRPLTGYDIDFVGPKSGYLKQVSADSNETRMPFADNAFNFVLAMDMLEHVPESRRAAMIQEMVRVSRDWILLTVPCGEVARQCDAWLFEYCQDLTGIAHRWAQEHLKLGLPEGREIEDMITAALNEFDGGKLTVTDNFNADLWVKIWKFMFSSRGRWMKIKNKLLWPLLPWVVRQNRPPTYRRVFTIDKHASRVEESSAALEPEKQGG